MSGIIWIICWLFTVGVAVDPSDKSKKWLIPVAVVAWPLLLGCCVRSHLSNATHQARSDSDVALNAVVGASARRGK